MSRIPRRKPRRLDNVEGEENSNLNPLTNQNEIPINRNNEIEDSRPQLNQNNENQENNSPNFIFDELDRRNLRNKMHHRHKADGAVNINVEEDDLKNDNYDLYENREINFEKPKINENIPKENTEYYIESLHHDEFLKIIQASSKEEEEKKEKGKIPILKPSLKEESYQQKNIVDEEPEMTNLKSAKQLKRRKPLTNIELRELTEKKLFQKFDDELTQVITKTMSKVTLIFLFAQGILAGMGLLHIIILTSMENWENFRRTHGNMVMIMFNIFHTLSFASIVGNGIKFISAYQKYNLIRNKFNRDSISIFTRLKKKMYFSAVLLIFFVFVFGFEVFLVTRVQRLNYIGCVENDEFYDNIADEDFFKGYRNIHYIVDILVILLFILNVFDVNVEPEEEKIIQPKVEVNYYLGEQDDTNDDGI
jgi:hypothetical protein